MNEMHEIATFAKGSRERLRLSLDLYRDVRLFNYRLLAPLAGGVWTPTQLGVSIRIEQLPQIADATAEALRRAREMGWLGGDK